MFEIFKIKRTEWAVRGQKYPIVQLVVIDLDTKDVLVFNVGNTTAPLFYKYQDDPELVWSFICRARYQGQEISKLEFLLLQGIGEDKVRYLFNKAQEINVET